MSQTGRFGSSDEATGIRLQRVLAAAGVGSRRHCEELIADGRVSVDGKPVTRQGVRVDPARAIVRVDGERVVVDPNLVYLVLNKPRGMLTALSDAQGRPCVGDLLEGRRTRLFHVGRLDADSEGLLLLTNDGELANRLMHPRYGVPKTYLAEVPGPLRRRSMAALRAGVELDGERVDVDQVSVTGHIDDRVLLEITVHEGRKHVVRRLLDEVGHPVQRLVRLSVGPIHLGGLRPGRLRSMSPHDVNKLYQLVDM
jgi:23S rRNA pseudouridine2605 synthase